MPPVLPFSQATRILRWEDEGAPLYRYWLKGKPSPAKLRYLLGFIHLGKEPHTSTMVDSRANVFLYRAVGSFNRFLAEGVWSIEEVTE